MKKQFTHILTLLTMALVMAAVPVCTFAATGGKRHVREILFAGIAIAFAIDMWREFKKRK